MKVKDCMCTDACVCTPDNSVCDCAKIMNENHIGCVPVCNSEDKVVGIITDRDIVLRCVACGKNPENTKLSEVMTCNDVCCCTPEQDICDAQNDMCNSQIRRIPVVDENNKIVGMLSLGDLARNQDISKEQIGQTIEDICCNNKKHCC